MGKRLHNQRRGNATNAYMKIPGRAKADVRFSSRAVQTRLTGEVVEFIDDPMHSAPLMLVRFEDRTENTFLAPEGIKIGDKIQEGRTADLLLGSIMPLETVPDGTVVYNVEVTPGDGGKIARSSGSYATVVAHGTGTTSLLLPSKRTLDISSNCRAEIGAVAGGGQQTQPLMKAGKNFYIKHATNTRWPLNRGVKSNPVDHPFGGKQHHKGASSMTSRNAPPGAKVGHIAARRVGRKKRG